MNDELVMQVARNNAEWCDAVCQAQGKAGEFLDDLWINFHPTPPFYPNAVTLNENREVQMKHIRDLLQSGLRGSIGIKDSFHRLDLAPLGFEIWLTAEWLYYPEPLAAPEIHLGGVAWRKIEAQAGLIAWEAAWNSGSDESVHIFEPSLLADHNIAFFGAYNNQRIIAGGIANKTGDVVGVSNIFTPAEAAKDFWTGFLGAVLGEFPGLPLVGYERGAELEIARSLGFQSLGALRVWGKHIS